MLNKSSALFVETVVASTKNMLNIKNAGTYKGRCLLMFVYSKCWMHYWSFSMLCVINPLDSYYSLHNGFHSSLKTWGKLAAGIWCSAPWLFWKKLSRSLSDNSFQREKKSNVSYIMKIFFYTKLHLHTMTYCVLLIIGKYLSDLIRITHEINLSLLYRSAMGFLDPHIAQM